MESYVEPEMMELEEEKEGFYFPTEFRNPKSLVIMGGIGLGLLWLLAPRMKMLALAGLIGLGIWFYNRNRR